MMRIKTINLIGSVLCFLVFSQVFAQAGLKLEKNQEQMLQSLRRLLPKRWNKKMKNGMIKLNFPGLLMCITCTISIQNKEETLMRPVLSKQAIRTLRLTRWRLRSKKLLKKVLLGGFGSISKTARTTHFKKLLILKVMAFTITTCSNRHI